MNKVLNIDLLVLHGDLQSREEISETAVSEYAEDIKAGDSFPAVLVYFDGIEYYLTDGYHRYHAHKRAEKASILCEVVNGTYRDAILRSTGANPDHGVRRTSADKRKAVMKLLNDDEWKKWSNIAIAKQCKVSASLVASLRDADVTDVKYKTATGKEATKKKNPGRVAKEKPAEKPLEKAAPVPEKPADNPFDPRDELIEHLTKENDQLIMDLALAHMGGTEEEKSEAREMITSLREEVRLLNIELDAVKINRDQYQSENSQLKKQVLAMQRQIKKLEG
jgi:hypothetical protein